MVIRAKRLWASLITARDWFDVYFSIPPAQYQGFSFNMTTQIVHCLSALYDVMTLDEPGWDKYRARSEVDFIAILDKSTELFSEAASILGGRETDNYFLVFVKFFQKARVGLVATLQEQPTDSNGVIDGSIPMEPATLPNMFDLEFLDNEAFWNYIVMQDTTDGAMSSLPS
jgi:hypothetical protein